MSFCLPFLKVAKENYFMSYKAKKIILASQVNCWSMVL